MTWLYVDHDFKPVGQGLFAFGCVAFRAIQKGKRMMKIPGQKPSWDFAWVYDCGTSSSKALVHRGIREIERTLGRRLDLVVISHLHSDHISGLTNLLNEVGASSIMLPWAPLWRRLVIGFDDGLNADDPEMGFYIDPVSYLATEAPDTFDRIVFVMPSGDDGPTDPDEPEPDLGPDDFEPTGEMDGKWAMPEASALNKRLELPDTLENQRFAREMPPGGRIVEKATWEFVPYNDPKSAPASPERLRKHVRKLTPELLGSDHSKRKEALAALKELYKKEFRTGLENDLSLCLYTGPVPLHSYLPEPSLDGTSANITDSRVPMLYTGDGNFSTKKHLDRMIRFFGAKRIMATSTFQVPHHGSKKNWKVGSASRVSPSHSVFCSDPNGHYKHPSPEIWREFSSYGPQQVDKHTGLKWAEELNVKKAP